MSEKPLVSVICLCYNHEAFVREAILSVLHQTYPFIELIVVDDASTDKSASVIEGERQVHSEITFIRLPQRLGNCRAFNYGWRAARGSFVIDLAADDCLLPNRVARGVEEFQKRPSYGVQFSDAELIDERGNRLGFHSDRFPHVSIPQGDLYEHLIQRYFICSPSMMFRMEVLTDLNGYDEQLTYEDFDFWIRSSRTYLYCYLPDVLIKRRVVKKSLGAQQFTLRSSHQFSTYRVCEKILKLNQTSSERAALARRLLYECRQSLRLLHVELFVKYALLWWRNRMARQS